MSFYLDLRGRGIDAVFDLHRSALRLGEREVSICEFQDIDFQPSQILIRYATNNGVGMIGDANKIADALGLRFEPRKDGEPYSLRLMRT